ncbi:hypothetical protein AVP1_0143 [Aeromonas phage AVP1]|nr:hypothetical protein AVP1_0143 [Aeromonas phage AVP1]
MNKQVKIEVPANVTGMEVWKAFEAKGKPVLQISETEWQQASGATDYYDHWSEISTQGHKVALGIDDHGRHVIMIKGEGFIFQRYSDSSTTWALNGIQKLHDNVGHSAIELDGWKYICERFKVQPVVECEPAIVDQGEEKEMAPKDKVIKITVTNEQAQSEANQIKEEPKMTQTTSALNLNSDMNNAAPAVSTNTENLGISVTTGVLVAAGAALGTCLGIQYVENRFDLTSNVITGAAVTLAAATSFGAAKAGLNEKLGTYSGIASHAAMGALVGGLTAHSLKFGADKYLPSLELQDDATELALIEGTELPVLEA